MRYQHVFARDHSQEGRQGTPLLERGGNRRVSGGRVVQRHVLYLGVDVSSFSPNPANCGQTSETAQWRVTS